MFALKCRHGGQTLALAGEGVAEGEGKVAWLFGRHPVCDFVLEHGSVSRQHAWVGWDDKGRLLVSDLGSAHGTTVNKVNPVCKPTAVVLTDGNVLGFGASSRTYIIRIISAADAAYMGDGPQQRYRRLCVLQLTMTCGDGGETSSSASFAGPPEVSPSALPRLPLRCSPLSEWPAPLQVAEFDAVLLDSGGRSGKPVVLGRHSSRCRPAINRLLTATCLRQLNATQAEIDNAPSLRACLSNLAEWLVEFDGDAPPVAAAAAASTLPCRSLPLLSRR